MAKAAALPRKKQLAAALLLVAGGLLTFQVVSRPLVSALEPYCLGAALNNLFSLFGGACALSAVALGAAAGAWPRQALLALGAVLLVQLVLGALRSAAGLVGEGFLLWCNFLATFLGALVVARAFPGRMLLLSALAGVGVFLGAWGISQRYLELPLLWRLTQARPELLQELLRTAAGQERLHSTRIFGTFGIANSFAAFLSLTIFAHLALLVLRLRASSFAGKKMAAVTWVVHGGGLAAQLFALLLTGSRGGWVAFGAGLVAAAGGATGLLRGKRALAAGGALALSLALLTLVLATGALPAARLPSESLRRRAHFWQAGWQMRGESPLLGLGSGKYAERFSTYKPIASYEIARTPHNGYLEALVETGPAGLVALLFLAFVVLTAGRRGGQEPDLAGADPLAAGGHPEPARWRFYGAAFAGLGFLTALWFYGAAGKHLAGVGYEALEGRFGPHLSARLGAALLVVVAALVAGAVFVGGLNLGAAPAFPWRAETAGKPRRWEILPAVLLRAALVAVFVHAAVDFTLSVPAVLMGVALLAGMLLACVPPGAAALAAPGRGGAVAALLAGAGALLLVRFLFYLPTVIEEYQTCGDQLESEMRRALELARPIPAGTGEHPTAAQEWEKLYRKLLEAREGYFFYAPFRDEAPEELLKAYLYQPAAGPYRPSFFPQWGEDRPQGHALRLCETVRRLRPQWFGAYSLAGKTYGLIGDYERAEEAYLQAWRLYPTQTRFLWLAGDAALLDGRKEAAGVHYGRAWQLAPQVADPSCSPYSALREAVAESAPNYAASLRARLLALLEPHPLSIPRLAVCLARVYHAHLEDKPSDRRQLEATASRLRRLAEALGEQSAADALLKAHLYELLGDGERAEPLWRALSRRQGEFADSILRDAQRWRWKWRRRETKPPGE